MIFCQYWPLIGEEVLCHYFCYHLYCLHIRIVKSPRRPSDLITAPLCSQSFFRQMPAFDWSRHSDHHLFHHSSCCFIFGPSTKSYRNQLFTVMFCILHDVAYVHFPRNEGLHIGCMTEERRCSFMGDYHQVGVHIGAGLTVWIQSNICQLTWGINIVLSS